MWQIIHLILEKLELQWDMNFGLITTDVVAYMKVSKNLA